MAVFVGLLSAPIGAAPASAAPDGPGADFWLNKSRIAPQPVQYRRRFEPVEEPDGETRWIEVDPERRSAPEAASPRRPQVEPDTRRWIETAPRRRFPEQPAAARPEPEPAPSATPPAEDRRVITLSPSSRSAGPTEETVAPAPARPTPARPAARSTPESTAPASPAPASPAPASPALASPAPARPAAPQTTRRPCDYAACAARYRSFRASDCSYQPFEGPRRACRAGNPTLAAPAAPPEPTPLSKEPKKTNLAPNQAKRTAPKPQQNSSDAPQRASASVSADGARLLGWFDLSALSAFGFFCLYAFARLWSAPPRTGPRRPAGPQRAAADSASLRPRRLGDV